jgi:hypothetical protein
LGLRLAGGTGGIFAVMHFSLFEAKRRPHADVPTRLEHPTNSSVLPEKGVRMTNPKTGLGSNTQKDPDDWVSGDDPMTGAQASYLKTLCEQAGMPERFRQNLSKAEASKMIDEMRQEANVA